MEPVVDFAVLKLVEDVVVLFAILGVVLNVVKVDEVVGATDELVSVLLLERVVPKSSTFCRDTKHKQNKS